LVAAVTSAFVEARVAVDRAKLARQSSETLQDLNKRVGGSKTHVSAAQRIDLNNAEIQEARARLDAAAAERVRDNAFTTLRRLVGAPLDQDIELLGSANAQIRPLPSPADLVARALRQRPDVVSQRHDLERADAQIALVQREQVPNVNLSANLSRFEGATLSGGDIGFQLPVFQRKTADLNEAIAERERARFALESAERTVQQEALEARRSCEATAADLQALRDVIVPKTEENVQLQGHLYERGEAAYSDWISAQLELLTVRREYLDAVQAYNEAWIELDRVVGGLD
jgi:cobalt-zinc-cadmium efflux system outer membrane protein